MQTTHKIINGDSRVLNEIDDNSVHLALTSPPYWQLKDYGEKSQIGFYDTYENYINNLNLVWSECYRVLQNGCRLCVNIGDQYARSVYYGRYKVIPIRTEIIKFCETIGFDYMGAIIWQKVTTTNTTGGAAVMGSFPNPRNGILKLDYEFILIFKKGGKPEPINPEMKRLSKMSKEEWNTYFTGHWNFAGAKQDKHIAVFPNELPKRLIKMFSFVGDTVLDPFLGSGTTSLVAKDLDRNSVGYEINSEFLPIIIDKLGVNQRDIFDEAKFDFTKQNLGKVDFKEKIKDLPYIFEDKVKLSKKIDPRKLQFGSKINKKSSLKEDFFSVKRIISPEILLLSNDLKIRLIGISENKKINGKAIEYLEKKLKGQKVFLKYDDEKHDSENNLMCYLYLKNKTFINAHLIKEGLVKVDFESDYKLKKKFIGLEKG